MSAVVARLGPDFLVGRDERGRPLFDLPGALRPDPETPAPVRLLGEFDTILLAYADRSRVVSAADWPEIYTTNGIIKATFLVDGFVRGLWTIERASRGATATRMLRPFASGAPLSPAVLAELEEEGLRLLAFAAADANSLAVHVEC